MLLRFDPFREMERLTQSPWNGSAFGGNAIPLDVYRRGEEFVVRVDLPGFDPNSIDLSVEKNVLTLSAERSWAPSDGDEVLVSERPQGSFVRRLFLGDGLDTDKISANYEHGVLTVIVPVQESAKTRKVEVSIGSAPKPVIETTSTETVNA